MASVDGSDSTSAVVDIGIELINALRGIGAPGSFASFAGLSERTDPELTVQGVGDIDLPLSDTQARKLIAKARQAPYGKGSETLVDKKVRNTWEIDANDVTFRNRFWSYSLNSICREAAEGLGIDGSTIRAELYKMLIYEKGAMFKPHTDTEKMPGMFGTLVLCLPSPHKGGELILKHGGEKKIFKTSEHDRSYACWYSDVSHEVRPVKSGYRWVLTYNLAHNPSQPRPTAGIKPPNYHALQQALSGWLTAGAGLRRNQCLYHILDHEYTEANMSLQSLKSHDLARLQALNEMCHQLPLHLFFCLLEKEERGECDHDDESDASHHYIEEVLETDYKVKALVDLNGNLVSENLPINAYDILETDMFDDLEPEDEEYEGYMGNWGPTATHWYRLAAVVLIPRDSLISFLKKEYEDPPSKNTTLQLGYLSKRCLVPETPQSSIDALVEFCQRTWERSDRPRWPPPNNPWPRRGPAPPAEVIEKVLVDSHAMQHVFQAALHHEMYDFFDQAVDHSKGCTPEGFTVWLKEWLGTDEERFNKVQKGVSSIISSCSDLPHKVAAVMTLAPTPGSSSPGAVTIPEYMFDWARGILSSSIEVCELKKLGGQDGSIIIDLASYFKNPIAFLEQYLVPKLDGSNDTMPFSLGLLGQLQQQSDRKRFPTRSCTRLSRSIAGPIASSMDFTKFCSEEGIETRTEKRRRSSNDASRIQRQTAIHPHLVADLFSALLNMSTNTSNFAKSFVSKLAVDAPELSSTDLRTMWMPLLHSLIPVLTSNKIPLDTACYQQLYSAILKAFLDKVVKPEPTRGDLIRPRVDCSCDVCAKVSEFLQNPMKMAIKFIAKKLQRMHMQQKLDSAKIDCIYETSRSGPVYGLVITKTFTQYTQKFERWKVRQAHGAKEIEKFDQYQLRELLGPEYVEIVGMHRLLVTRPPQASAVPSSNQARPSEPRVGRKRKLRSSGPWIED